MEENNIICEPINDHGVCRAIPDLDTEYLVYLYVVHLTVEVNVVGS